MPRDTLTRSSWLERPHTLADTLSDTLSDPPVRYAYSYWREWRGERLPSGDVLLRSNPEDFRDDYLSRRSYTFREVLRRRLAPGMRFEAEWAVPLDRESYFIWRTDPQRYGYNPYGYSYDPQRIYERGDTLFTVTSPAEAGGIMPEGKVYRFCGDSVRRVHADVRAVLTASVMIYPSERDAWEELLDVIEAPLGGCMVDSCSYRLPVVREVRIPAGQARNLRRNAVTVLNLHLHEKRDSVLGVRTGGHPAFRRKALSELEERLPPHWPLASRLEELQVRFELYYFLVDARIERIDGRSERRVHLAGFETIIP